MPLYPLSPHRQGAIMGFLKSRNGGDPTRYAICVCVLLLAPLFSFAGELISVPKEVKGKPGQFIKITATTEGKVVKWISLDPDLAVFPSDLLKDTKTTVVVAPKSDFAKSYKVLAYTSIADVPTDPVECLVSIDGPPAPPPPPPGPVPPPVDELTKELKTLFISEATPDKKKVLTDLIALYKALPGYVDKANNAGELRQLISQGQAGMGIKPDALKSMRDRIMVELNKELPRDQKAPLVNKDAIKAAFAKYQKALEGVLS